jgi:upstream activation factor subunit UAF30
MARQTKSSKTQKESEAQVVETTTPVPEQPEKKRKSKKQEPSSQVEEAQVVEQQPKQRKQKKSSVETETPKTEQPQETVSDESEQKESDKRRREVTRESLEQDFDDLLKLLNDETENLRSSDSKHRSVGVKFLRQVVKRVKTLKSDTQRVSKQRTRSSRPANTSSGFMKPVKISKDMAKFTGWNPDELKSRVSITKALCQYIKDNNLQNPEDRRQIVPDSKLAKLLDYDQKKDGKPLTYYYLQQKIQPHFSSE